MGLLDQQYTPQVFEPIMEKSDCKMRIDGAEVGKPWKHKVLFCCVWR